MESRIVQKNSLKRSGNEKEKRVKKEDGYGPGRRKSPDSGKLSQTSGRWGIIATSPAQSQPKPEQQEGCG